MADLYPNGLQYYAASVGAAGIALNDNFALLDVILGIISKSSGTVTIASSSNGDIKIEPNGTGNIDLGSDTMTGDLILNHFGPSWGLSWQNLGTEYGNLELDASGSSFNFYKDHITDNPAFRINTGSAASGSNFVTVSAENAADPTISVADSGASNVGLKLISKNTGDITMDCDGGNFVIDHDGVDPETWIVFNSGGSEVARMNFEAGGQYYQFFDASAANEFARIDQSYSFFPSAWIGDFSTNPSPSTILHVYENNTNIDTSAGITIEQDGTGDAMLHWLLTAAKHVSLGLDNSNSDQLVLNDSGSNVLVANTSSGYFGINRNPAATVDIDGGTTGSTTRTDLRFTTDFGFTNYAQGTGIEWWGGNSSFTMATIRGTAMSADVMALTFSTYNAGEAALKTGLFIADDQTVGIGKYFGDANGYYPDGQLHVYSDHTGTTKTMQVWDWDSASPADNDTMYFDYYGQSDLGNRHTYAQQRLKFLDVTDGTEDAEWELYLSSNGILQEVLNIHVTNGFTINAPGPTILTGMTVNTKETTGNTPTTTLKSNAATTGTVASGFGTAWEIELENSSGSAHAAGSLGIRWTDPTNLSEDSEWFLKLYSGGVEVEAASINDSGNLVLLGTLTTGGSGSGQSTFPQGLVVNDDGGSAAADNFRAETANVTDALEVDAANDKVVINVPLQVEYRASAPGTLVNGMVWMESDGLHIYYNSAEKVVAGV